LLLDSTLHDLFLLLMQEYDLFGLLFFYKHLVNNCLQLIFFLNYLLFNILFYFSFLLKLVIFELGLFLLL